MLSRKLAVLVIGAALLAPVPAHAIPAWARRYNVNCNYCHAPVVPRLNATGYAFRWRGFRMPEEEAIGENQEVSNISDYVSARFDFRYTYRKVESEPTAANAFDLNNATIFAGGAIGRHFGAFMEFETAIDEPVELQNTLYGVWGKEDSYGGARVGMMHWLLRGSVAGFDRPTGLSAFTPLGSPLTQGGVPFRFAQDELSAELFYVKSKNRFSVQLLNGINAEGIEGHSPNTKDFAVIDQLIYDPYGSGVTAVAYFGSIDDLDPDVDETAHYQRYAITANKIYKGFEVMGGYVYAKDNDLPVGAVFNAESVTGYGFWGYAGYTFPNANSLTAYGSYQLINSNTDIDDAGNNRFLLGLALPVNLPEYLKLVAEYTFDNPRNADNPNTQAFAVQALLVF